MAKEKKFISIVAYLYNCENSVNDFLNFILNFVSNHFSSFELVLVDDCSNDSTIDIVNKLLKKNCKSAMINIIHMGYHQGIETSMNAGRDFAIGDFVYEFDSLTVNYDEDVLMGAFREIQNNYDIIFASPKNKGKLSSRIFYFFFNLFNRTSNVISSESFKIISRRAINRIKSMGDYIPYRKVAYTQSGLKYKTYSFEEKIGNNSNVINTRERTKLALDSFMYFTNALETISKILCAVFLLLTIVVGMYVLIDICYGNPVEGWLSIMGFLALGFFGVFLLLTIVIRFLSSILELTIKKQHYVVRDVEKIK